MSRTLAEVIDAIATVPAHERLQSLTCCEMCGIRMALAGHRRQPQATHVAHSIDAALCVDCWQLAHGGWIARVA